MSLHVRQGGRVDPRPLAGPDDDRRLRLRVGGREARRPSAVVLGRAPDHAVDLVAVGERAGEGLEEDGADPLAPDVPVRGGVEGPAAAVGAQHPGLRERVEEVRGEERVHPPRDREVAVAAPHRLDGAVDGDEGARAGGVDRFARAVQVEKARDAVGQDRMRDPRRGVGVARHPRARHQVAVVEARHPHEDPGRRARQVRRPVPRVLDRRPDRLQEEPLLRVHEARLAGRDAEEGRVEPVHVRHEAGASRDRAPRLVRRPSARVLALRGDLRHEVGPGSEVPPERLEVPRAGHHPAHADDGDRLGAFTRGVPSPLSLRRWRHRSAGRRSHRAGGRPGPALWPARGLGGRGLPGPPGHGTGRLRRRGEAGRDGRGDALQGGMLEEESRREGEAPAVVQPVGQLGEPDRVETVVAQVRVEVDVSGPHTQDLADGFPDTASRGLDGVEGRRDRGRSDGPGRSAGLQSRRSREGRAGDEVPQPHDVARKRQAAAPLRRRDPLEERDSLGGAERHEAERREEPLPFRPSLHAAVPPGGPRDRERPSAAETQRPPPLAAEREAVEERVRERVSRLEVVPQDPGDGREEREQPERLLSRGFVEEERPLDLRREDGPSGARRRHPRGVVDGVHRPEPAPRRREEALDVLGTRDVGGNVDRLGPQPLQLPQEGGARLVRRRAAGEDEPRAGTPGQVRGEEPPQPAYPPRHEGDLRPRCRALRAVGQVDLRETQDEPLLPRVPHLAVDRRASSRFRQEERDEVRRGLRPEERLRHVDDPARDVGSFPRQAPGQASERGEGGLGALHALPGHDEEVDSPAGPCSRHRASDREARIEPSHELGLEIRRVPGPEDEDGPGRDAARHQLARQRPRVLGRAGARLERESAERTEAIPGDHLDREVSPAIAFFSRDRPPQGLTPAGPAVEEDDSPQGRRRRGGQRGGSPGRPDDEEPCGQASPDSRGRRDLRPRPRDGAQGQARQSHGDAPSLVGEGDVEPARPGLPPRLVVGTRDRVGVGTSGEISRDVERLEGVGEIEDVPALRPQDPEDRLQGPVEHREVEARAGERERFGPFQPGDRLPVSRQEFPHGAERGAVRDPARPERQVELLPAGRARAATQDGREVERAGGAVLPAGPLPEHEPSPDVLHGAARQDERHLSAGPLLHLQLQLDDGPLGDGDRPRPDDVPEPRDAPPRQRPLSPRTGHLEGRDPRERLHALDDVLADAWVRPVEPLHDPRGRGRRRGRGRLGSGEPVAPPRERIGREDVEATLRERDSRLPAKLSEADLGPRDPLAGQRTPVVALLGRERAGAEEARLARLAGQEAAELRPEPGQARDDGGQTRLHRLAQLEDGSHFREGPAGVVDRVVGGDARPLEGREELGRVIAQPLLGPGGERDELHAGVAPGRAGKPFPRRDASAHGARRSFLHDHVAVRPAVAERADGGPSRRPFPRRPAPGRAVHEEGARLEAEVSVLTRDVERRRDALVTEGEEDLDEADDARRRRRVAEIALHRAERAETPAVREGPERVGERPDLDRVAEARPGAVRLHVPDRPGVDAAPLQHFADERGLRLPARRRDPVRPAVLVDARAPDHAVDAVAVALRVGEALQDDHGHGLPHRDAVGVVVERPAASGGREHPGLAHQDERLLVEVERHAAGQHEVGLSPPQALAREVNTHESRRAGGVDAEGRALQVEEVRDTRRQDGARVPQHRLRHARGGALAPQPLPVVAVERPRHHATARPVHRRPGVAGVFQRRPAGLEEEPLLRVHHERLGGRDAEERRVELEDAVHEAAPPAHRPVRGARVRVEVPVPVPAAGRHLRDRVDPRRQVPPQLAHLAGEGESPRHPDHGDVALRPGRPRGDAHGTGRDRPRGGELPRGVAAERPERRVVVEGPNFEARTQLPVDLLQELQAEEGADPVLGERGARIEPRGLRPERAGRDPGDPLDQRRHVRRLDRSRPGHGRRDRPRPRRVPALLGLPERLPVRDRLHERRSAPPGELFHALASPLLDRQEHVGEESRVEGEAEPVPPPVLLGDGPEVGPALGQPGEVGIEIGVGEEGRDLAAGIHAAGDVQARPREDGTPLLDVARELAPLPEPHGRGGPGHDVGQDQTAPGGEVGRDVREERFLALHVEGHLEADHEVVDAGKCLGRAVAAEDAATPFEPGAANPLLSRARLGRRERVAVRRERPVRPRQPDQVRGEPAPEVEEPPDAAEVHVPEGDASQLELLLPHEAGLGRVLPGVGHHVQPGEPGHELGERGEGEESLLVGASRGNGGVVVTRHRRIACGASRGLRGLSDGRGRPVPVEPAPDALEGSRRQRGAAAPACLRRLLDDEEDLDAPRAEGAEERAAGQARGRPRGGRLGDEERRPLEPDLRARLPRHPDRRHLAVPDLEQDLRQLSDARSRLEVPDGRLEGAERAAPGRPPCEDAPQPLPLDRVRDFGANGLRLHVADRAGVEPRRSEDAREERRLGAGRGRVEAVAPPLVRKARGADDAVDVIAVRERPRQRPEEDGAHPFPGDEPLSATFVQPSRPRGREEPSLRQPPVPRRVEVEVHAPRHGELAFAPAQALAGEVKGGERRGAGRVHDEAGTRPIEEVRDPVCERERRGVGRREVGGPRLGEGQRVGVRRGSHEDAHAPARELRLRVPRVLERPPGHLQEQTLLGGHPPSLERRDPERERVEAVDVGEERPPLPDHVGGGHPHQGPALPRTAGDRRPSLAEQAPELLEAPGSRVAAGDPHDRDVDRSGIAAPSRLDRRRGGGRKALPVIFREVLGESAEGRVLEDEGLRKRSELLLHPADQLGREDRVEAKVGEVHVLVRDRHAELELREEEPFQVGAGARPDGRRPGRGRPLLLPGALGAGRGGHGRRPRHPVALTGERVWGNRDAPPPFRRELAPVDLGAGDPETGELFQVPLREPPGFEPSRLFPRGRGLPHPPGEDPALLRGAVRESLQEAPQLAQVARHDGEPLLHRLAAELRGPRDVGEGEARSGPLPHERGEPAGRLAKALLVPRGEEDEPGGAVLRSLLPAVRYRRFLQDEVRVGSPRSEGADAGPEGRARPLRELPLDPERRPQEPEVRVEDLGVERRDEPAMLEL